MYYIGAMWTSKSHAKEKGESLLISHYDQFLMINKLVTKLEVRAYD